MNNSKRLDNDSNNYSQRHLCSRNIKWRHSHIYLEDLHDVFCCNLFIHITVFHLRNSYCCGVTDFISGVIYCAGGVANKSFGGVLLSDKCHVTEWQMSWHSGDRWHLTEWQVSCHWVTGVIAFKWHVAFLLSDKCHVTEWQVSSHSSGISMSDRCHLTYSASVI